MSISWYDFIDRYSEWSESTLRTRISQLVEIGSGDEVVDVIFDFPTEQLKGQLIRKAIRLKVIFTHDDFENLDGELSDADYKALAAYTGFDTDDPYIDDDSYLDIEEEQPKPKPIGLLGALTALFSRLSEGNHSHDSGKCDGNCDTCPAHFGYRHGRWYYGHGHQWGCERGGNGGASGKCNRD